MFTEHPWVSALCEEQGTLCEKMSRSLKELSLQLETCEETAVQEGSFCLASYCTPLLYPQLPGYTSILPLGLPQSGGGGAGQGQKRERDGASHHNWKR